MGLEDLQPQAGLSKVQSDVLRTNQQASLSIGILEQKLLEMFPKEDAMEWDRTGLLCGDPTAPINGVAIALDATATAVQQAKECGTNVLITHHPAFIDPPQAFGPLSTSYQGSESCIWEAIRNGVALMNFHTTLDVSVQAQKILPSMLGLTQTGILCPIDSDSMKGYGQICTSEEELNLEQLAARCVSVFGRLPRVWGNTSKSLARIVTATGSGGSLFDDCIQQGIDTLVCGEVHYHDALAATEAGLTIIELGHDVSELPLSAVLAASVEQCGIPNTQITLLDQSGNWWTPEAIRR